MKNTNNKEIWRKETQEQESFEEGELRRAYFSVEQAEYESKPNQKQSEIPHNWERAKHLANKANQKQFKEFDESLFKAYIDKFSDEDKIEMFEVLFKESKKWDGVNNAAPFYMSICRAYNAGKQSILNQKSAQDRGENPEKFFVSSDTYFKKEFGFE